MTGTARLSRARALRKSIWAIALGLALLMGASCSREPQPLLSAHELIGATPETLVQRLGEPRMERDENGPHFGAMRWVDVEGAEVMAVIVGGVATYVSYQFKGMEAFDEAAALERIAVELPAAEPLKLGDGAARRWEPCGPFERLTVNPETRLISLGTHPWKAAAPESENAGED